MLEFQLLSDTELKDIAEYVIEGPCYDLTDYEELGNVGTTNSCRKCKSNVCLGHFGLVKFPFNIYHVGFSSCILEMVKSLCFNCEKISYHSIKCINCECLLNKSIEFTKNYENIVNKNNRSQIYDIDFIKRSFNKHGKDFAKGLIINSVLIPPIKIEEYEKNSELIKTYYDQLFKSLKANKGIHYSLKKILSISSSTGVIGTLGKKEGLLRRYLLGKRLDRSIRSVVTGDPNIHIDQVFVPKIACESLLVTEKVNKLNIEKLRKELNIPLVVGMEIKRPLMDDDYCFLNRQPSLTKNSLMSFRIKKRIDGLKTISIHPFVTPAFNADFDGDEMNIFALSVDYENQVEQKEISNVLNNLEFVYPIQDSVLAVYLMTSNRYKIPLHLYYSCLLVCNKDLKDSSLFDPEKSQILFEMCLSDKIVCKDLLTYPITKPGLVSICKREQSISRENGINIMEKIQKVSTLYLETIGFSVNIDYISDEEKKLSDTYVTMKRFMNENKNLEHIANMVDSCSKGNLVHCSQMFSKLGKQKDVDCKTNYLEGLSLDDFFAHQESARVSLIHTGVSTAETGYLNRRACKIMANTKIEYNGAIYEGEKLISFPSEKKRENRVIKHKSS